MVDFNNETTIGKPPKELVALIIIEKFYNFLEADEDYIKKRLGGASWPISTCRARLRTLYLVAYPMLQRRMPPEEFETLKRICEDHKHETTEAELLRAFQSISVILDTLGLTKLDDRPTFKRHKIEEANKAQGYG